MVEEGVVSISMDLQIFLSIEAEARCCPEGSNFKEYTADWSCFNRSHGRARMNIIFREVTDYMCKRKSSYPVSFKLHVGSEES